MSDMEAGRQLFKIVQKDSIIFHQLMKLRAMQGKKPMTSKEVLEKLMLVDDDPDAFDVRDLVTCVTREIAMRLSVYPNRVTAGKMTLQAAMDEVSMMKAILKLIEKAKREKQSDLFA